jgi:RND family efflux transporter MFP subunit
MRTVLIVLALLALGAAAWSLTRPQAVATVVLHAGTAAEIVYATGVVEPVRWAAIAPISRGRIVDRCACEGEAVAAETPILRLDDAAARAHAAELAARLQLAERALARAEELVTRRVLPAERLETAEALVLELTAAQAAQLAQIDDLTLRAPLDGTILRLDAEVGEVAEPGVPLAWVGEPRPLRLTAEVNEEDIPRVRPGQRALLRADAFPDQPLEAVVDSITPMGDPTLRTYRVRLALPDDTPLMIGMTAEVNIVVRTVEGATLLPAVAVVEGAVYVVEDDRLRRVPVTLAVAGPETVAVAEGLPPGTRVVSPATAVLRDGARVRVRP